MPEHTDQSPAFTWPHDQRSRARFTRGTFLLHLRPITLSRYAARWTHTFGLGGSSLVLWLILAGTGVLMLLVYQPAPAGAYDSVQKLSTTVRFGALVRGVHYWSANLLIAVMSLHVARVVFTGGYHRPRRLNWMIGAALLLLVLASAFTGYLLPWDQRAYWAVTISTAMLGYIPWLGETLQATFRGGDDIGANTLLTYYTFHTTALPALAIAAMAFHFWRVRKAGGVIEPQDNATRDGQNDDVVWASSPSDAATHTSSLSSGAPVKRTSESVETRGSARFQFFPDLLTREVAQALVIIAVIVVLGAFAGAPFGERANPGMSPNPAKAPWYFLGFQELLIHLHPTFAVLALPAIIIVGFIALPWLGDDRGLAGRWFLSPAGRRAALLAACVAIVLCVTAVVLDDARAPANDAAQSWLTRGVLPTVAFAVLLLAIATLARRWLKLSRNEVVQTIVIFVVATFATLTVIGVFFRGAGMRLTTPWSG